MSLLEVMVSQSIALVILAAMMSLIVSMITRMQAETAASDAQVRLRQVTHLLLRDTQGVGASSGAATGDIVFITDGGATAADTFTIFKRDESVCGGGLATTGLASYANTNVPIAKVTTCLITTPACPVVDINARSIQLVGKDRSFAISGQTASNCMISLPTGATATAAVAAYNARFKTSHPDLKAILNELKPTQILFGSNFTYRVENLTLERSTNSGVSFLPVMENVHDLQVMRVYMPSSGEETRVTDTTGTKLPLGITEDDFVGIRLGVVTFAKSRDNKTVAPPTKFGNRDLISAAGVRYRSSFVFAASRNRPGA